MIQKLWPMTKGYRLQTFLAPLTICGEVVMEVLIPYVMARMVDVGINGDGGVQYTVKMGLLMCLMAVVSMCFGALAGRFAAVASVGFSKNLRKAMFDKVQDFSFANVDHFSTASLVTRLTTDVNNAQNAFMMIVRMAFRAPVMLVFALVMAVSINARMAMVFLVALPILGVSLYFIATRAFPRFKDMLSKFDRMNATVQENLIAVRVVKAFVREDYEKIKFEEEASAVKAAQRRAEKLVVLNMPIMQLSMYACIVAVIWFGGNMIAQGTFRIGEMSSFISYVTQILMSLMMVSMIFIMSILSAASINRITEVLDEKLDIPDAARDSGLAPADGSVEFQNVSFSYSGDAKRMSLMDVNLRLNSGESVGLIGGTGSAKSTLVQLIPRLYDATSGHVLVGGRDVKDYPLENLRNDVAMVLQKNVLFSGTIRDNLKWGNEAATDQEIEAACRAACAHEFIMSFPKGYDTDLGQGGVNVSGGQKQRLCIARALLKKPKILILDDSTSAVDTATDAQIRKAFREQLPDTTKIVIAQRIASVMDADKIIVLDEGRVADVGSHDELMARSEIYREVYTSQQKGVA